MQEFSFTVQASTTEGETVCVTGDCLELGNWQPRDALRLTKIEDNIDGEIWQASAVLQNVPAVNYRYFICVVLDRNAEYLQPEVIVRRWETHLLPRKWIPGEIKQLEKFGYIDDVWKVESGWLTVESVVQLKFYNNPIQIWKKRYLTNQFYIKVTPVDLERRDSAMFEEDSTEDHNEDDMKSALAWPIVEIAVMNSDDCEFKMQEQFGRVYFQDEFFIFNAQMLRPETISKMISRLMMITSLLRIDDA